MQGVIDPLILVSLRILKLVIHNSPLSKSWACYRQQALMQGVRRLSAAALWSISFNPLVQELLCTTNSTLYFGAQVRHCSTVLYFSAYSSTHYTVNYILCTTVVHKDEEYTLSTFEHIPHNGVVHNEYVQHSAGTVCTVYFFQTHPSGHQVVCTVQCTFKHTPQGTPSLLSTLPLSSIRFTLLLLSFLAGRFLALIISLLPHYFSLFFNHCSFSPSSPALFFLSIPPWIVSLDPFFLTSLLNIHLHNVCFPSPQTSTYCSLLNGWTLPRHEKE